MVEGDEEEAAAVKEVDQEFLRNRWKPLIVKTDFFKQCKKHAINYILAENYERTLFFAECENVDFQDENGHSIWSTSGEGQIDVPAKVGVYIVRGKVRILDEKILQET